VIRLHAKERPVPVGPAPVIGGPTDKQEAGGDAELARVCDEAGQNEDGAHTRD